MKRYKDCSLNCSEGQQSMALLDIVMQVSVSCGYTADRYSSILKDDTIAVYVNEDGLPSSRLIICAIDNSDKVSIVNIVPNVDSGISHIECIEYNQILDSFKNKVFCAIKEKYGNTIDENTEDYTIEDIIPLSFPRLNTWLSMYPLSGHPLDEKRWYAFVIALHLNGEYLPLTDFEKYIQENYGWAEDVIERFAIKLESQLELLEYYDEHR